MTGDQDVPANSQGQALPLSSGRGGKDGAEQNWQDSMSNGAGGCRRGSQGWLRAVGRWGGGVSLREAVIWEEEDRAVRSP